MNHETWARETFIGENWHICDGCESDCETEGDCIFCHICNQEHNADDAGYCSHCKEPVILNP